MLHRSTGTEICIGDDFETLLTFLIWGSPKTTYSFTNTVAIPPALQVRLNFVTLVR